MNNIKEVTLTTLEVAEMMEIEHWKHTGTVKERTSMH